MDVYLRGGRFSGCPRLGDAPAGARRLVASASRSRKRVRKLWGRDRGGRFRTHGRHSQATVRGTRWLTVDRCDGTLTRVTNGAVVGARLRAPPHACWSAPATRTSPGRAPRSGD